MAKFRCAILDDYQQVALHMADWAPLEDRIDFDAFTEPMASSPEALAKRLRGYEIVVAMRESRAWEAESQRMNCSQMRYSTNCIGGI